MAKGGIIGLVTISWILIGCASNRVVDNINLSRLHYHRAVRFTNAEIQSRTYNTQGVSCVLRRTISHATQDGHNLVLLIYGDTLSQAELGFDLYRELRPTLNNEVMYDLVCHDFQHGELNKVKFDEVEGVTVIQVFRQNKDKRSLIIRNYKYEYDKKNGVGEPSSEIIYQNDQVNPTRQP